MRLNAPLRTKRLLLRTLEPSDVGPTYLAWLHDPEVIRQLEARFLPRQTLADLEAFVASVNASASSVMAGIFLLNGMRHIGNIKLGPVVIEHERAEVAFMIGEKDCWGLGYASEAIVSVAEYGLGRLGLRKITSGCYETNVGSARALLKAGFVHEATILNHVAFEGTRVASLLFGLDR